MSAQDLQRDTIRIYKTLVDQREDWGGRLVLLCGPGCALGGTPAAVSIAAGGTLAIDSDAAAMKAAMRSGYLDFVVNSLDEALRALKNEVRQKRPLSVGLIADVNVTLTEMVERGVQPDLWDAFPSHGARDAALLSAFEAFLERQGRLNSDHDEDKLSAAFYGNLYYFAVSEVADLRTIDQALRSVLPVGNQVRRRWVERVSRYLREARFGGRWIWLTDEEREAMERQGLIPAQQP